MQNGITKLGRHIGTHNKEGHKAGGARLQAEIKWKKHPKLWVGFGQLFTEAEIPLHPSMVTSSHLLRILILELWLANGKANGKTIFL